MLRIMTLNLRFDSVEDGPNSWEFRRDAAFETINDYSPDLLGTQEGLPHQIEYLESRLEGYRVYAPGRSLKDAPQLPTILYREELLEPIEGGEFWLSQTPHVPMSRSWGSKWPRMAAYGLFRMGGETLTFLVTHLDNISAMARIKGARMILEFLKKRKGPVVVAGDMNEAPGLGVYRLFTCDPLGLVDPWDVLGMPSGKDSYTFHGFTGHPECARIDWILFSRNFTPRACFLIRESRQGRYPSDHFPVVADADFGEPR